MKILNKYRKMDSWFQVRYSFNPYRGCEHGCIYCDGRSNCYWPRGGNEQFSTKIWVKLNAPYLLRKELAKIRGREPTAVGGGVTDIYQPCEEKYEVTRKCLEVLARVKYPSHLMTKSSLILRDVDILKELSEDNWCFVSVSFSTVDDSIAKIFEPRCSPPSVRLDVVSKLNREGVKTGITFMPILPFITDSGEQLEGAFREFKRADAKYVIVGSLTLRDFQQNYFMKVLAAHCPDIVLKYNKLYKNGYSPIPSYVKKLYTKTNRLSEKYSIPPKMPRFFQINKQVQKKLVL